MRDLSDASAVNSMLYPIKILNAKLQVPQCARALPRRRFGYLLAQIPAKKLTMIIAGAGYGKTTLAAQITRQLRSPVVWYRIDRSEEDLVSFLTYLICGIRRHYPSFGGDILRHLQVAENIGRERKQIFTLFVSEMEHRLQDDLILVLDDYHWVQESEKINELMEFLLANAPDRLHLVIVGRTHPNLSISRLQAAHAVDTLSEKELAFTPDETGRLYATLLKAPLAGEHLQTIQDNTGGWIAGLMLYYHALKGKGDEAAPELLLQNRQHRRLFFNYLEENVYHTLPGEIKKFLKMTSILEKMDAHICNTLLDIENASNILGDFEKSNLFTVSMGSGSGVFLYHHLFQAFLRDRLESEHRMEEIARLHCRAARIYEEEGEVEAALTHYLQGNCFAQVVRLLKEHGERITVTRRPRLIQSVIDKIPADIRRVEPRLQYLQALLLEYAGRTIEAEALYRALLDESRKREDHLNAATYRVSLASIHFQAGNFRQSQMMLREAIRQPLLDTKTRLFALHLLIYTSAALGDLDDTDRYYRAAEALLPQIADDRRRALSRAKLYIARGFRLQNSGDFQAALEISEKAMTIALRHDFYRLQAYYCQQTLWHCYTLGRFAEGIHRAQTGLDIIDRLGFDDLFLKAWICIGAAYNYAGLKRIDEALAKAEDGLMHFREMNYAFGQASYYGFRCLVCMKAEDFDGADRYLQAGLAAAEDRNLGIFESELNAKLAALKIEQDELEEAGRLLDELTPAIAHSKWHVALLHYLWALLHRAQGDRRKAGDCLRACIGICEQNSYAFSEISVPDRTGPLLRDLAERGVQPRWAASMTGAERTDTLRGGTAASTSLYRRTAADLHVRMFGRFAVTMGTTQIPEKGWSGRKEQTLFKYLALHRLTGFLKKELLMEVLWPNEDPLKTAKRFHVIITYLRNILEPGRQRGRPSAYIVSAGDAYRLEVGKNGDIDCELFAEVFAKGRAASALDVRLEHFLKCEALYTGDLLQEDLYADWCETPRERFRQEYLSILLEIIACYEKKDDISACIAYTDRYLARDKYAENVYRMRMQYYSRMDNIFMLKKTYAACRKNIEMELDCPLSAETKRLFRELTAGRI